MFVIPTTSWPFFKTKQNHLFFFSFLFSFFHGVIVIHKTFGLFAGRVGKRPNQAGLDVSLLHHARYCQGESCLHSRHNACESCIVIE